MTFGISSTHKNTLFRARSAVLARDFELAIRLFKRLLQEFPDNLELLHELATTYIRSEQDEQALAIYQQILQKDRNDYGALIGLGGIYRRMGRFEESVNVLEQALSLDGDSVQTFYTLGFTYKQMGRFDDALECFDHVIEQNPGDILAYNHLGTIYSLRGDSKNAVASYRRGLQLDTNHPILHYNLAQEYEKLGYYDEVISEYEAALRAKPGWSDAINSYALFLMSHNQHKEAYNILCQGIEVTPENIHLQRSMGMVQLKRSEYHDAGQRFETVLRQEEADSHSLLGLADVYSHEGRNEESRSLLKRVEPVQEKSKGVQLQYVRSLLNANRFQEAGELLNELLNEYRFDLGVGHLLAEYFACCDDLERLQQTLDKIFEIDSNYFLHFLDVALRFRQIGNLEKAQVYLIEYLKRLPNDSVALSALASCYEKGNQYGDAMRFYQQALNWDSDNSYLQKAVERISLYSQLESKPEESQEDFVPAPKVVSSLRDIYSDDGARQPVHREQGQRWTGLNPLIDEEHYRENHNDHFLLQPEKSTEKKRNLDYYDPLKLESNESEEEFENSKPHLGALTHDDGPVDYEPLFGINPALDFQSEEDEIFDNVNQKPDEIFLQEGKSEPEPIGEPVATPRGELLEQPFEEPQFDSWPETQELPMSPDPDDVDSLPPQRPSKPALSSEDFLPPKEYPVKMEGELSEPTFIPESEIEDRMPFQSEVDMPWDFNNEAAGMGDEQKLSLDEIEEADEAYEATLPHHETDTVAKEIEQLLENPVMPKENTAILGLFQELKRLCEYLPQEEKNGFNSSMKALQMEYIISKLSGKPGLMELAENIREKGLVEVPAERYDIVERFDELAASARIMNVMRPFVQQLPDKNNSSLLDDSLQHLLDRLSKI
ncbi:MAG: tetratricopeptide repeat protein [Spirochaetia bacterium]|nr:tetratricopeptide repeat protein [Spirochaetia bacterium]